MNRLLAAICLMIALAAPALGQQEKGMLGDAHRFILPNGMTVLHLYKDSLPMVTATVLVKSGSTSEPQEKAGLASITAGLLNDGTARLSAMAFSEEAEFIGASMGASATYDYSAASMSVTKDNLERAMELFTQMLRSPAFKDEELARAKALAIAGLKQSEEDPEHVASREFIRAVHGEQSPYGRLVEGSKETIETITRNDVTEFYKAHYTPVNMILSIAGDLTEKELQALLSKYFSDWPAGTMPQPAAPALPQFKPSRVLLPKPLAQSTIMLGHQGPSLQSPDRYALSVLNYILGGGGFSSRLMDVVRDDKGLVYGIYSVFSMRLHSGLFYVSAQTKNESAAEVVDVTLKEMERLRTEPVGPQELKDAKDFMVGSFTRRLETLSSIASSMAQYEYQALGLDYPEKYKKAIQALTTEDILRVAQKYLHPSEYTLTVLGDMSKTKGLEGGN